MARTGIQRITLWDDDIVASHNLGNQVFRNKDINKPKTTALAEILKEINPDIEITEKGKCSTSERIAGFIFLCVDNIDVRRELCTAWAKKPDIRFVIDGRMRLTDGTIYAADWSKYTDKDDFIASMQYTHKEALEATPVTACGYTQSIVYCPRVLASLMVANFIKYLKLNVYNKFILVDLQSMAIDAYSTNI